MVTTMDSAGRLVLPKAARDRARIRPGVPLEVRVVDGRIEIEAAPTRVTLEQRDGFWVASPVEAVPTLSQEQVNRTTDALRTAASGAEGDTD